MHSIWEEAAWQQWPVWHGEEGRQSYSEALAECDQAVKKNSTEKPNTNPHPKPRTCFASCCKFFWTVVSRQRCPKCKMFPKTSVFLNSHSYAVIYHGSSRFAFVEGLGCKNFWHV